METAGHKKSDAMTRAYDLLKWPLDKRPELLRCFIQHCLAHQLSTLYACCVYAQVVEGHECDDAIYRATDRDRQWFKQWEQVTA